jgi:hypothetical protein
VQTIAWRQTRPHAVAHPTLNDGNASMDELPVRRPSRVKTRLIVHWRSHNTLRYVQIQCITQNKGGLRTPANLRLYDLSFWKQNLRDCLENFRLYYYQANVDKKDKFGYNVVYIFATQFKTLDNSHAQLLVFQFI